MHVCTKLHMGWWGGGSFWSVCYSHSFDAYAILDISCIHTYVYTRTWPCWLLMLIVVPWSSLLTLMQTVWPWLREVPLPTSGRSSVAMSWVLCFHGGPSRITKRDIPILMVYSYMCRHCMLIGCIAYEREYRYYLWTVMHYMCMTLKCVHINLCMWLHCVIHMHRMWVTMVPPRLPLFVCIQS